MSNKEWPLTLKLEPDTGAIEAWQDAAKGILPPEKVNNALALAINRTLSSTRSEAIRQARAQYTIKREVLLDSAREYKASATRLSAKLVFVGGRIPLIKFTVSPNYPSPYPGVNPKSRPDLKVKIRRDGGGAAKHLFVAKVGDVHTSVFKRRGPSSLPIDEQTGPSVVSMVGNDDAREAIQAKSRKVLTERVDHEMRRLMK